MTKLIAYLIALVRRLEHRAVGAVEDAMSPIERILNDLRGIEERAGNAEEVARAEVMGLLDHAGKLADKRYAARAKIEKLEKLIG